MTTWYLWPVNNDPVTNEYLAKGIGEQHPECERRDVLCADGERRNLFVCPAGYDDVRTATTATSRFKLRLEVFKEDIEDVIVRYDLWKESARRTGREASFKRARHSK